VFRALDHPTRRHAKQGRERLYRLEKNSLNAARYWFTSFDG
jgi:hypothetical protein